jgi:hypothetical protein
LAQLFHWAFLACLPVALMLFFGGQPIPGALVFFVGTPLFWALRNWSSQGGGTWDPGAPSRWITGRDIADEWTTPLGHVIIQEAVKGRRRTNQELHDDLETLPNDELEGIYFGAQQLIALYLQNHPAIPLHAVRRNPTIARLMRLRNIAQAILAGRGTRLGHPPGPQNELP